MQTHEAHPHPHHHAEETCCAGHAVPAGALLDAAEEHCRRQGLRLTPQRRAVLDALVRARGPLGAYDLIEALRPDGARGPAPIAIYRALDFLKENGFIHRLESLNAFIACPHRHTHGERVVFLICESCRHVEEATAKPLDAALARLARDHGFTPARQIVELAGTCRHCRQPAAKA
ncbi:MAG TPA: Fur family transcriptional regulator [Rhabdaerophilum sp.]|nr:Fur family transcriptional regulator [Rhabdaerophilum sp.]